MIPLGLLHMRPLQYWFEANVPSHAWRLGSFHLRVTHHCIKTPWKSSHLFQSGIPLGLTSRRKVVTTDASNSGWGAPYKGRPAFGSWADLERCLYINFLETGIFSSPKNFPTGLKGAPRPGPLRQHDGGSFYKSPRRSQVTFPLQVYSTHPFMGTGQTPLTDSSSRARQTEPRKGHAVTRRMEAASQDGSDNLVCLWEGRGAPLHLRRQLSLPNYNDWPSACLYAFPLIALLPQVIRRIW